MKSSRRTKSKEVFFQYAKLDFVYTFDPRFRSMVDLPLIKDVEDSVKILQEHQASLGYIQEFFTIILLNRANRVLGIKTINQGSMVQTIVDVQYIVRLSLSIGAMGVILCHNHNSGNITPSSHDYQLTKKISKALNLLDIQLLDHIILSDNPEIWYSMAKMGEI